MEDPGRRGEGAAAAADIRRPPSKAFEEPAISRPGRPRSTSPNFVSRVFTSLRRGRRRARKPQQSEAPAQQRPRANSLGAREPKATMAFEECRQTIRRLSSGKKKPRAKGEEGLEATPVTLAARLEEEDSPLTSLAKPKPDGATAHLDGGDAEMTRKRGQRIEPAGQARHSSHQMSDAEFGLSEGDAGLRARERNTPPTRIADDCGVLHDVALSTVDDECIPCYEYLDENQCSNFIALVGPSVDRICLTPILNQRVYQCYDVVSVFVNGQRVPAGGDDAPYACLELERGTNAFAVVVKYQKTQASLVCDEDEYSLFVQRGPTPEGGAHGKGEAKEVSPGIGSVYLDGATHRNVALDNAMRRVSIFEGSISSMQAKVGRGDAALTSQGRAGPTHPKPKTQSAPPVPRQITPDSPLVGFPEVPESVSSSHSSGGPHTPRLFGAHAVTDATRARYDGEEGEEAEEEGGEAGGMGRMRADVPADTKHESSPSAKLEATTAKVAHISQAMSQTLRRRHERERRQMGVAFDRIRRLESQMAQAGGKYEARMAAVQASLSSTVAESRHDLVARQRAHESRTDARVHQIEDEVRRFREDIRARIAEERELILDQSNRMERSLELTANKLGTLLDGMRHNAEASVDRIDQELDRVRASHAHACDRVGALERSASEMHHVQDVTARRVDGLCDFRSRVLADVATLEELIHKEKQERQAEDTEIIHALDVYTESFTRTLHADDGATYC